MAQTCSGMLRRAAPGLFHNLTAATAETWAKVPASSWATSGRMSTVAFSSTNSGSKASEPFWSDLQQEMTRLREVLQQHNRRYVIGIRQIECAPWFA